MRPQRQVRRAGMRPNYVRGRSAPRRKPQLPEIKVAWVKLAAIGTLILLVLFGVAKATAITGVKVSGTHSLAADHVQRLAEEGLHQQLFGRNLILMNSVALADHLEQADPAIKQANIHRRWFHTVGITITERQPTLNWKSGGAVYLLDSDATVIGPTKGQYARLPTVVDSTNLPVKTGDRVAPSSFVAFCSQLAKLLPAAGYTVGEMTVPETTSEVYVRTSKGLTLKFDTTRPAGDEVSDLQAVSSELTRARKAPIEYIDLRIEHKAYYK